MPLALLLSPQVAALLFGVAPTDHCVLADSGALMLLVAPCLTAVNARV
jgi:hypothetical protein